MQEIEKEQEIEGRPAPADPNSQPLIPVSIPEGDTQDDDPDEIFLNAVAEIDTQPLVKKRKPIVINIIDIVQIFFCSSLILCGMVGMVWQCITYPHTLVILYTVEKPANLTTILDIPTRTLAPVTLTREATIPTTGHGHQDARPATGTLTFYNGNANPQTVAIGTVFTGGDGIQVSTDQSVTIPAANPPNFGQATITATTIRAGSISNIHSYDINGTVSSSLFVKNLQVFTGGRDARDFQAVAQTDVDNVTSQVTHILLSSFQTAFTLRPGEQAQPTNCHTTTTASHSIGEEANTVTVKAVETCSAVAYNSQQLTRQATAAFTQTKPAATYHVVGSVQTTLQSVSPLVVTISGKWVYTFSPDYEQLLAQRIAGDSPARAKAYLFKTGVISYASVPNTLPPAMYINFLVLVGKNT